MVARCGLLWASTRYLGVSRLISVLRWKLCQNCYAKPRALHRQAQNRQLTSSLAATGGACCFEERLVANVRKFDPDDAELVGAGAGPLLRKSAGMNSSETIAKHKNATSAYTKPVQHKSTRCNAHHAK